MLQALYSACKQIWIIKMKLQLIDEKETKQMDINQIKSNEIESKLARIVLFMSRILHASEDSLVCFS